MIHDVVSQNPSSTIWFAGTGPPRTERIKHHLAHPGPSAPPLKNHLPLLQRPFAGAAKSPGLGKVGQTMQTCQDANHSEALTLLQLRSELSPSLGLSIFLFDIPEGPTLALSPKQKTGNSTSWTLTAKQTYLKPLFHCFSQGITKALFISVFRCTCK